MRRDPKAEIVLHSQWGDYHLLRIETPAVAAEARPGQFLMVRAGDTATPLLRRPISLHARDGGALEIFFQIAGQGTALLARMREGERLDILGPCGRGFIVDPSDAPSPAILVGGGRGIAPLFFLAQELIAGGTRVRVLYGGKSRPDLPALSKFEKAGIEIACSTDDGSYGRPGFVTDLLEAEVRRAKPAILYVCGPDPMMKTTAEIAAAHRIRARLSLESIMGCGFGACWGCVKRIKTNAAGAWRKICDDGPVFESDEIVWDEGD